MMNCAARNLCWGLLFLCAAAGFAQSDDLPLADLLDMGLKELAELKITSVSKRAEVISDAPATVRVISAEQIRERGYLTLDQALADLPGFQFRNPQSLNSYVFIRGIPNQNNLALVLIDGLEMNELNSGGFYGGGQYNLENVKRIEVIYGPASALYGTNAVSGVINIVTKDPDDGPQGLSVSAGYGGFDTGLGGLRFSFFDPKKESGLRVSAMYKTTKQADLSGDDNDGLWTSDLELYEHDLSLDIKARRRDFLLGLNYQNRISSAATYYPALGTSYRDNGTRWNLRFLNLYLQHEKALSGSVSLQSKIYARETTVLDDSVREINDDGQFGFFRPNYRIGAEITMDGRFFRDLNLVAGLVLEKDWLAENYSISQSASPQEKPDQPSWPEMTSATLFSAYVQGVYKPLPMLQITTGLRMDCSSVYDVVLTPRGGALFTWKDLSVKLLYGRAFRAPKPWDFTDGLGNAGLDPERMQSLELSLGYRYRDLIRLETAFYWNRVDDMISRKSVVADDGSENWYWTNIGQVDTFGLELGSEIWIGAFRSFVNYTYTRAVDETGRLIAEIAAHGANLGLTCRLSDRVRASVWCNLIGARRNPQPIAATGSDRIEAAFIWNASLSCLDLKGFDLQIVAHNLLDEVYFHPSNRPPDRYRQPQRTVMTTFTYRF